MLSSIGENKSYLNKLNIEGVDTWSDLGGPNSTDKATYEVLRNLTL